MSRLKLSALNRHSKVLCAARVQVECFRVWAFTPGKLEIPYEAFAAGLGDYRMVTTLCPGGKERMRRLMEVVRSGRGVLLSAFVVEIVLTFLLVFTVLGATDLRAPVGFAGIAIGLVLTLIHLVGIPVTNTSVNPARSIGPAIFVGGWALSQLWLFIGAPIIGAAIAAAIYSVTHRPVTLITAKELMVGRMLEANGRPAFDCAPILKELVEHYQNEVGNSG